MIVMTILLMRIIRDEMKEKNLNPDINIEQEDNQNNPHWTKTY